MARDEAERTMSGRDGSFLQLRVLLPFIFVVLISGSTWIVIRDQLGGVPPAWSITYRFIIGAAAMFVYAAMAGQSLRIGKDGHLLAALFGILQFMLTYNFVYAAEEHITSGLVATAFALLFVPNSALAWLFLKQRVKGRFLAGSALAVTGIALLFVQELRSSEAPQSKVLLGIGLTLLSVLSVSAANVIQASDRLRSRPIATLLAWGMFYGVLVNGAVAWLVSGPPVIEYRIGYLMGLAYLGLFASALNFTFNFGLIRAIGPGKAAYTGVLVPILAMALSTIFENYRWSTLAVAGGMFAVVGLVIALRSGKSAASALPVSN